MNTSKLILAGVASLLVLSGCPAEVPPDPVVPTSATIESFTASPQQAAPGEQVTLSWKVTGATSVAIHTLEGAAVELGDRTAQSGSVTVTAEANAVYVLSANGEGGSDKQAVSVAVTDAEQAPLFAAFPAEVVAGEPTTLIWNVPGAEAVSITDADGAQLYSGSNSAGSLDVVPTRDSVFTLDVDGATVTTQVTIAPAIFAFVATPAAGEAGQPLTLSWKAGGVDSVTLSSEGRGDLTTLTDPGQIADGAFVDTLPSDLPQQGLVSYQLLATRGSRSVIQKLTVYVGADPVISEFTVPAQAKAGGAFIVSWQTGLADRLVILVDGVAQYTATTQTEVNAGSVTLNTPAAEAEVTLQVTNARGGVATRTEKVMPLGAPMLVSFSATPATLGFGGDPATVTWEITNARQATLKIQGGPVIYEDTGVTAEQGSVTVYPNKQTVYVLEVDNLLGDALTQMGTVDVTTPAQLHFDPASAPLGATVAVTTPTLPNAASIEFQPLLHNAPGEAFIDISTTGIDMNYVGPDLTSDEQTLPATFNTVLFGQPVSTNEITVSINGWMGFASSTVSTDVPVALPTTALEPFAVAPFFADLRDNATGEIFVQLDTVGSEQRLIVQWDNVEYDPGPTGNAMTFQAQIYGSGKVVFAYDDVQIAAGDTVYIGMQDGAEAVAVSAPSVVPADGDTFTLLSGYVGIAPQPLPATMPVVAGQVAARVHFSNGGYIDIDQAYPVLPSGMFDITELNVTPAVTDGQWFEVRNNTAQNLDLSGWELDFGATTHAISTGTVLPASGTMVFAQSANAADGVTVDYVYGASNAVVAGGALAFKVAGGAYATLALPQASLPAGVSWQVGATAAGLTTAGGVTELACLAATASTYGTNGQRGTPGAANTPCPNYAYTGAITANFEPISTTGTPLTFADLDDGIATINLPVPVVFDQRSFSSIVVGTNGYVSLVPITCDTYCWSSNKTLPDPSPSDTSLPPYGLIAPFWDDNDLRTKGGVYWERKVPGLQPNDGYTIVSWEGVYHYNQTTDDLNFQVKFFDTGDVEFHFGTMTGETGSTATTWFENPEGTAAFIVNADSATPGIASNTAYRITAQ